MKMHDKRLPRGALVMALGLLQCLAPGLAWALPEDPGILTYSKTSLLKTLAGKPVYFDLYIPKVSAPAPVVALGHGFARSRLQMEGWGKLLASRGYVAAAPDLPGPIPDHAVNGKVLAALLDWMVAEAAKTGSTLFGKVDGTRRGVMGHSAGGLASVLAAPGDAKIDVVVGLDPVEWNGMGVKEAPKIKAPVAFIRAEPHQCNEQGNAAKLYAALTGPRLTLQVIKGTHCDPEWSSGPLCTLVCGGTDTQRQARFRRYAMATLDHVLMCSPSMAPWLGGASAKADTLIKGLASAGFPPKQLGCAGAADGGIPDAAGPGPDTASSVDQAPALDVPASDQGSHGDQAASPDGSASPGGDMDGCSCSTGGSGGLAEPLLMLLLTGAALLRSRSWRRRRRAWIQ